MKTRFIVLCLATIMLFATACEFSVTTARLSEIQTSTGIDEDYQAVGVTDVFDTKAEYVYLTGLIRNAPSDTKVTIEWYYTESDPAYLIDALEFVFNTPRDRFYSSLSKPDTDWPVGEYEIKLYVNEKHVETAEFRVE